MNAPTVARAAVLIPLVWSEEQWQLLYIRRAENPHDRHSGQVAFPGGRYEDADGDLAVTAMREAEEEIGLRRELVQKITPIPGLVQVGATELHGFAGIAPWPVSLTLQSSEVARTFLLPLNFVAHPEHYRIERWKDTRLSPPQWRDVIFYQTHNGETLWGATARMTHLFLEALQRGDITLPTAGD